MFNFRAGHDQREKIVSLKIFSLKICDSYDYVR